MNNRQANDRLPERCLVECYLVEIVDQTESEQSELDCVKHEDSSVHLTEATLITKSSCKERIASRQKHFTIRLNRPTRSEEREYQVSFDGSVFRIAFLVLIK